MAALQMLSLAQALHMEVVHGMQLHRNIQGLKIAKSWGFTGNRKPAALRWVLQEMEDAGVHIPDSLAKWRAENPA